MKLFIPTLAVLTFSTLILPCANADTCWLGYGITDPKAVGLVSEESKVDDYSKMSRAETDYIGQILSITDAIPTTLLSSNPAVYYRLERSNDDLPHTVLQGLQNHQMCDRKYYENLIHEGNYSGRYFVRIEGSGIDLEGSHYGSGSNDGTETPKASGVILTNPQDPATQWVWKVYYVEFKPTELSHSRFVQPGTKHPF